MLGNCLNSSFKQIWPPQEILVSDWSLFKFFFSETAGLIEAKLGRKHLWKDLYDNGSFRPDSFTNISKQNKHSL
jgi:hypothetical protein